MKRRIRILSYNIHKGFSFANRRFVLDEIRMSIREQNPDIVCLQEVSGENKSHQAKIENYPLSAQFEFLADQSWSHFAYGKNALYEAGNHGNAILSRLPIVSWENIDLSTNRFESRGLLRAAVQAPDGPPIHIMTTHLNLLQNSRNVQASHICDEIGKKVPSHEALILAGDFNDWPGRLSRQLKSAASLDEAFLCCDGRHPKTFPSFWPRLALDRIYFRNLEVITATTLHGGHWKNLSDHLPVMADFEF